MFIIDSKKNIHVNRGDQIAIKFTSIDEKTFSPGDVIKFSIMKEKDCSTVLFQKEYEVEEESLTFTIVLESEETRLGEILKNKVMTYWYEVELNGIDTLIGYDIDGPKSFFLYPEAATISVEGE